MTSEETLVFDKIREMVAERQEKKIFPYIVMTSDLSRQISIDDKTLKNCLNHLYQMGYILPRPTTKGLAIELK